MTLLRRPRPRTAPVLLCLLAVAMLAGCGKSERELTTEERLKSVQQRQESQPEFYAPRNRVDYMSDLKNLRESPAGAPKAADAKSAPAAAPTPTPAPAPVVQTPAPVQQPAPRPAAPAPAPVATPTPAPAQAVTPPPTQPAPAPQAARAADTTVTVTNRETPNFPREAIRQGIDSGVVRARVTVSANGEATNVTIVSAKPPRVFDREVQSTLSKWRFNPGAEGRTFETEINFQR